MALRKTDIDALNPWWGNAKTWQANDLHLKQLEQQPARLPTELATEIPLFEAAVHTLRGPRQVGKSTDLKLIVQRALAEHRDPRQIIYLSLDLLYGEPLRELADTVRLAKRLAKGAGPSLLLLDEVTAVQNWQMAIKDLYDRGDIAQDSVICTGSSAVDLKSGLAEQLPGRRGAGIDHLVLPQSFANFAGALNLDIPPSPQLTLKEIVAETGRETIEKHEFMIPRLNAALERYLLFGGLPAAVAEAVTGLSEPSVSVQNVLYKSLYKEVQRKGASESALHGFLEQIVRSLGAKTNWSKVAREMDVPLGKSGPRAQTSHHVTIRDYIEFLAAGYFILVTYFWRQDADSNALSKDKKMYFADPLLHTIAHRISPGLPFDHPALVENVIGMALYQKYEPKDWQLESFAAPQRLHIWETTGRNEVDFVCGPRRDIAAVEVKYQHKPNANKAAAICRTFPGKPVVVATQETLLYRDGYALIPASLLLWALG